jgi:hypothetical protein
MIKETTIAVFVSNKFQSELDPFFWLFNQFWSETQPVEVVTINRPELPYRNLKYVRVHDALLTEGDWDFGRYSDGVQWYLRQLKTPLVIILDSDYWLTDPVDLGTLDILVDYMLDNPDVLRIQLGNQSGIDQYAIAREPYQGLVLLDCHEDNPHCFLKVSWIPGIWNRDLLQSVLQPNWNPWECEVEGTEKLKGMEGIRSLGSNRCVVRYRHICSTRLKRVHLSAFPLRLGQEIRPLLGGDMEVY